jgi:hypothetical protein
MRETTKARFGRLGALITAVVVSTSTAASAMPAVTENIAPGWQAFVGCWEPVAAPDAVVPDTAQAHLVCIVPVDGTTAVDMVTVVDGKVIQRERVDATGTKSSIRRDDCAGTQSATWSTVGQRLYVSSDLECDGGLRRTSTGVISMTSMYEWMDVQTVAVGGQKAVRVLRYREARPGVAVPAEITAALGPKPFSLSAARLAATAPVTSSDIVDVARHLDAAGAEVWLLEQKLAFTADSRRLVELTHAGVPASVIDVVVALSYPKRFAIDVNQREIAVRPGEPRVAGSSGSRYDGYGRMWDPYYSRYGSRYYSPFGYSQYGYGYGNGYGYSWYPGNQPVVIVVTSPTPAEPKVEGRAVKGRGYTRDRDHDAPAPAVRGRSGETKSGSGSSGNGASSGGTSSGGTSSGGTSSGGSSSGETGRTAKVRPPSGGN